MTPRAYIVRSSVPRIPLAQEAEELGLYPDSVNRAADHDTRLLRVDGLTVVQLKTLKDRAQTLGINFTEAVSFKSGDEWCEGILLLADDQAIGRLAREIAPLHASVSHALTNLVDALSRRPMVLRFRDCQIPLDGGSRVTLMGILNVTPDSFSDGGRFESVEAAVEHAKTLVDGGARIIDIGGESTRPGATPVGEDEELSRILPVLEKLKGTLPPQIVVSIDTMKARVARKAVEAGAEIINDVSGMEADPEMPAVAAETGAHVILNHMRGTPSTMQEAPSYRHVIPELVADLTLCTTAAIRAGVDHEKIIIDPGIGFGKRRSDNAAILRHLQAFVSLGRPVAIGVSRKSFLGLVSPDDGSASDDRADSTLAAETCAVLGGVHILRTHDPKQALRAARIAEAAAGLVEQESEVT